MIQRIDANTEDVVDNVQGAQRELMKYWSRVSGNRWLMAKMFGVLMVNQPRYQSCDARTDHDNRSSSSCGYSSRARSTCLGLAGRHLHINGVQRVSMYYSVQALAVFASQVHVVFSKGVHGESSLASVPSCHCLTAYLKLLPDHGQKCTKTTKKGQ